MAGGDWHDLLTLENKAVKQIIKAFNCKFCNSNAFNCKFCNQLHLILNCGTIRIISKGSIICSYQCEKISKEEQSKGFSSYS